MTKQELQHKLKLAKDKANEKINLKNELFAGELESILKQVFRDKINISGGPKAANKAKIQRILNLVISDTHYGSNLKTTETPSKFGWVEGSRRTASVIQQTADYKRDHRSETKLNLFLIGDIIQNKLHDQADGNPIAIQVAEAIHILSQAIAYLAKEFPNGVDVYCTPGNHGRMKDRHKERAIVEKYDSLENIIYFALKTALVNIKHVKFHIPLTPYIIWDAFGKKGFATHGDTTLGNIGYVGSNINVKAITAQTNSINVADKMDKYAAFVIGHVHIGTVVHLPNGSVFVSNGPLIPPGHFEQSMNVFQTNCGQQLFESTPNFFVGDNRFIKVDEKTDNNAELDKIILPFGGF